ncbi:MarR family transcriptional regulator [Actinomadura craniellae]|uniref:MarR family transcriptional regulator n=2 Tax=Actinomadura craniellae TaxID=2231787 RepID=A0A365H758_9ACTN|nr:MarR family transcriptional regulator [Actinomadura craniellae]
MSVMMSPTMLLILLGRSLRERIDDSLAGQGLSLRHLSALGHLVRVPGISYSELGRRAGVTAQSMQATVRQLEELGAVERDSPAGRGRTAELRVTPHGHAVLRDFRQRIADVDALLMGALPPDRQREFAPMLMRMADSALAPEPEKPGG